MNPGGWVKDAGGVIYGLFDPRNGEMRYVGKTQTDPILRLRSHVSVARRLDKHQHRDHWIRGLLALGLRPEIDVLERWETHDDLRDAEVWSIQYYRSIGCRLTNHTDGGEGALGYRHTEESRRKISAWHKGRKKGEQPHLWRLTESQSLEAERLYSEGLSLGEVAAKIGGITGGGVRKALRRRGVVLRKAVVGRWTSQRRLGSRSGFSLTEEQAQEAVRLYAIGHSAVTIGKLFGCSDRTVRYEFGKRGVPLRSAAASRWATARLKSQESQTKESSIISC